MRWKRRIAEQGADSGAGLDPNAKPNARLDANFDAGLDAGMAETAGMEDALRNFRSSIHAWSESQMRTRNAFEFARPQAIRCLPRRPAWRMAAAWAIAGVLAAGGFSAGFYARHQQTALATAVRAAHRRQLAAAQAAAHVRQQNEDLLATVDADIAQQVPTAMEPLAQLMDESDGQ